MQIRVDEGLIDYSVSAVVGRSLRGCVYNEIVSMMSKLNI